MDGADEYRFVNEEEAELAKTRQRDHPYDEIDDAIRAIKKVYERGYNDAVYNCVIKGAKEQTYFAQWERPNPTTTKSYVRICSRCKGTAYVIGRVEYLRCPWCGAIMKESEKETKNETQNKT